MKKLLCSACAVLGLYSSTAQARPWWVINFSTGRCDFSQISPAQAEQWLRSNNQVEGPPETKLFRDQTGALEGVLITGTYLNGNQGEWAFTTTPGGCENLRRALVAKGALQDPNELQ